MKPSYVLLVCILCTVLLTSGCTNVATNGSSDQPFWAKETTVPTQNISAPTMDTSYVSQATPYSTTTTPTTVPSTQPSVARPTPLPYLEVLHEKIVLGGNKTAAAWTINVTQAPLVVEFSVEPKMVTRTIVYDSSYGSHKEETKKVTTISDKSRLEVTVRDADGNIVAEDGFGGLYSVDRSKKIFVMAAGKYQLDIRGADVTVDLSATIGQTEQTAEDV